VVPEARAERAGLPVQPERAVARRVLQVVPDPVHRAVPQVEARQVVALEPRLAARACSVSRRSVLSVVSKVLSTSFKRRA
jgi:hypothetical protein